MTPKITLYMFTGSAPSTTVGLMLEHKGLEHRRKHLMVGPHAFGMLGRGFQTMTVPALKLDGRRIQGSRAISRELDELSPGRPLFPADAERRRAVADAERWGEELQDAVRRIVVASSRYGAAAFWAVYRHPKVLMRGVQHVSRPVVTKLATAGHRATDFATREDLAALPARLDRIDAWIAEGLLDGPELNAADFQIAPNIELLLRFDDLAAIIEHRPAARLARRVVPPGMDRIGHVLPRAWLEPLGPPPSAAGAPGAPRLGALEDVLRAAGIHG